MTDAMVPLFFRVVALCSAASTEVPYVTASRQIEDETTDGSKLAAFLADGASRSSRDVFRAVESDARKRQHKKNPAPSAPSR